MAGILVARSEGPRSFGLYAAALALASLTVGGATAGLPILLLRRASEGNLDRRILRRAVRLQLGFSVPTVLVTGGVSAALFGGLRGALAGLGSGLFFAANNVATLGQNVQAGRRRYQRSAATDVTAGLLFPTLTYAALRMGTGVNGSLVALAVACAISCSVAWTRLPTLDFDREPSPLGALDGMSFTAFGLVHAGYGRVDTIALVLVAGPAAAGYYSAGYRLLGPFALLGAAFLTVYFSRLCEYRADPERWAKMRRQATLLLATLATASMGALFVAAPLLIRLFYGSDYESSVGPARILLLSIVPWSLYWPKQADLASVHLEKRATIALAGGFVLNLVLVAAVGKRFGPTGAAWAWVVSESATLFGLSLMSRRIIKRVGLPSQAGQAQAAPG